MSEATLRPATRAEAQATAASRAEAQATAASRADTLGILYEMLGATVRVCYDGSAALAELGSFWPHVGLFDVNMPGIDGVELAGRVRAAARGRPLLLAAITGVSDADARARTAAVFDVHLTKPADPTGLFSLIRRFKDEHPDTSR